MEETSRSCVDCGVVNCQRLDKSFPDFCLTTKLEPEDLSETLDLYENDAYMHRVAVASAEVEKGFYCEYTRVEEIMEFARRIGAEKIGIATCVGLINESRTFAKILRGHGFAVYGVACKVGTVEKETIGIDGKYISKPGECICNPILQAKLLNKEKTDLNVVVGLCVGHDSMFYRYAQGLTTTLVTKDRVLGHNPVQALYTAHSYYKKLIK